MRSLLARLRTATLVGVAVALASTIAPAPASALPSAGVSSPTAPVPGLDVSWGSAGMGSPLTSAVNVRSIGARTYVTGSVRSWYDGQAAAVMALDEQGQWLPGFGTQGKVTLDPDMTGSRALDVLPAGGGKLLAVVHLGTGIDCCPLELVRFDALTGALDPTYGTGGRQQVDSFDVRVSVDAEGRAYFGNGGYVRRLTANGAPDESWGPGGDRSTDGFVVGAFSREPTGSMALLDHHFGSGVSSRLLRLRPDGSRDTGFGTNGVVDLPEPAYRVLALGNGDTLALGTSSCSAWIRRYTPTGAPSPAWGTGGKLDVTPAGSTTCRAAVADVQEDALGRLDVLLTGIDASPDASAQLLRLSSTGVRDPARAAHPWTDRARSMLPVALDVDDQGRVLLAGAELWPDGQPRNGTVARVLDDVRTQTSRFVPLPPTRVLDTRTGNGAPLAPVGEYGEIALPLLGRGGVPAGDVSAVVLNLTAVAPTTPSFVTAWPAGQWRPTASNLNTYRGRNVADQVTVKVGSGGQVVLYNDRGQVDLVADVAGYYTRAAAGQGFTPAPPRRLLDTRSRAPVGPGGTVDVDLTSLPADVTSVVLNVTAVAPTEGTYLTAFPKGTTRPLASSVNAAPGTVTPNLVTVSVHDRSVTIFNAVGHVHVLADLAGWYSGSSTGTYSPLPPARLLDTRSYDGAPVAAGQHVTLDVRSYGVPLGATAVSLTVTAVSPTAQSFVTVSPGGAPRPLASNLNTVAGTTVPNAVLVPVGPDGTIELYNDRGSVHLVADLSGYTVA